MKDKCTQNLTDWQQRAWEVVKMIPPGSVTTYKEVARASGRPQAARAVGNILAKNSKLVIIPCHRVVKSNGEIGGYAGGRGKKKELLEKEGIKLISGNKVDLDKCFFNLGD